MSIVPMGVKRFVSNPKVADFVENTIIAVSVETGLKMIGRPTFIMMDKEADSMEKKKYSATKEMLYQGICLTLYLSTMKYIKKGIYNLVSKGLSENNSENAEKLKKYNTLYANIEEKHNVMKKTVKSIVDKVKRKEFKNKALDEIIKLKEDMHNNEHLHLGKGAKEFSAIIGSILMLTVIAPQISHFVIHPLMKILGFDKHEGDHH